MTLQFSDIQKTLKEVTDNKISRLVSPQAVLLRSFPSLKQLKKAGKQYRMGVQLAHGGVMNHGGSGTITYNTSSLAKTLYEDAVFNSYPSVLSELIDYKALEEWQSEGKNTMETQVGHRVGALKMSAQKHQEIDMLYGQSTAGVGKIEAVGSVSGSGDTATLEITFYEASFAPAIFSGMLYQELEVRDSSGAKQYDDTSEPTPYVSAFNLPNRKITLKGDATELGKIAVDDFVHFAGMYANGQIGVQKQLTTTTGSLFDISRDTYDLWRPVTQSVGGQFKIPELLEYHSLLVDVGGLAEDTIGLVSPKTWEGFNADLAASREYDYSYNKDLAKIGVKAIRVQSQAGWCDLISHPFIKRGEGAIIPKSSLRRVGLHDIIFTNPGSGLLYIPLDSTEQVRVNARYDMQVFIEAPARSMWLTGITN